MKKLRLKYLEIECKVYCFLVGKFRTVKVFLGKYQRQLWFRLCLRGNELHSSLNPDYNRMRKMNKKQRAKYRVSIIRKRRIAHDEDLSR